MGWEHVVPEFILKMDDLTSNNDSKCIDFNIQGTGNETRDFIFIDDFIDGLPNKYEEEIGEQGVIFSGGQRQRVALARAMYKDAPILVLDEATSALDTKSEMYIQKALEEMQKGRKTVVIAHRLSTIQNADVIVVMDKGKIIEQGSHKELLKKGQAYKQLHALQFGDEDKSISTPE